MADQRLDIKTQELATAQADSESEEIRQATVRRQLSQEEREQASNFSKLRILEEQKRAAEAELRDVQSALSSKTTDDVEDHELMQRKKTLTAHIDDLDHRLVFLQQQE